MSLLAFALHNQPEIEDIFHEVAHVLVSPRSRRGMPNYGLGQIGGLGGPNLKINYKKADKEEEEASILGIHLLWRFGYKEAARATWRYHSWDNAPRGSRTWAKALNVLRCAIKHAHLYNRGDADSGV